MFKSVIKWVAAGVLMLFVLGPVFIVWGKFMDFLMEVL